MEEDLSKEKLNELKKEFQQQKKDLSNLRFQLNSTNSQKETWDCKTCGKAGNQYTFITMLHEMYLANTTDADYIKLASQRKGIKESSIRDAGWAWDASNHRWLVPYANGSPFLNNLGAFNPQYGYKIFKSPGMPIKLYRPFDKTSLKDNVIILEGEWDLLAIKPFVPDEYSLVAVPGSMTFKPEFIQLFENKRVMLLYDKDDSGKTGTAKAIRLLSNVSKSISVFNWPEDFNFPSCDKSNEPGKDIRDLVHHLI